MTTLIVTYLRFLSWNQKWVVFTAGSCSEASRGDHTHAHPFQRAIATPRKVKNPFFPSVAVWFSKCHQGLLPLPSRERIFPVALGSRDPPRLGNMDLNQWEYNLDFLLKSSFFQCTLLYRKTFQICLGICKAYCLKKTTRKNWRLFSTSR